LRGAPRTKRAGWPVVELVTTRCRGGRPEMRGTLVNFRFSNRPVGSSLLDSPPLQCRCRSQARVSRRNQHQGLPSWVPKMRWNNLWVGLAVRLMADPSGHTNSPHRSSREGHLSTAQWSSSILLFMSSRLPWSSGTRCRQPKCGARSRPGDALPLLRNVRQLL